MFYSRESHPYLERSFMSETDLEGLRLSAAGLLLYQEILLHPLVQAGLELIDVLTERRPRVEVLAAYGRLFLQMAEGNIGWCQVVIQQIQLADNPFSRAATRGPLDQIPSPLVDAAAHDLGCLQVLSDALDRLYPELRNQGVQVEWPAFEEKPGWACLPSWSEIEALESLADHYRAQGIGICARFRAFRWQQGLKGVEYVDPIQMEQLHGYERQKQQLCANTEALLAGRGALHVLLYGARGTGKSSLVKAMLNRYGDRGLRLLELSRSQLTDLPEILVDLRTRPQPFILFVDDLSFEADETEFKHLKVLLEGDIAAQPDHVRLYATTNRRHLIREFFPDRPSPADDEVHAWDTVQEKLSLRDRFGLTLTFPPFNQARFLSTLEHLVQHFQLQADPEEIRQKALLWAQQQNGFSGRTVRQFIDVWQAGYSTPESGSHPKI